jgi:hypothetical protein
LGFFKALFFSIKPQKSPPQGWKSLNSGVGPLFEESTLSLRAFISKQGFNHHPVLLTPAKTSLKSRIIEPSVLLKVPPVYSKAVILFFSDKKVSFL